MDLNADVAESFGRWQLGDDEAMLALVTSANVACGFHAGDPTTLRRTCAMAAAGGVVVGAQVSYRDLAGFGRRFVDVSAEDLAADVLYQLGAVAAMCQASQAEVRYVKPHGALHAAVVEHEEQARAVVEAVAAYDPRLAVLGLPGSALLAAADRAGVRGVAEAFADRAYTAGGTLVPRSQPGAVLSDPDEVAERVLRLVVDGVVEAQDGSSVPVTAESVCVHGDSPGAVAMVRAVRERLTAAGLPPAPFVRT
ncbi:MAG TPA: 5-oxoprolinase subunit PxpA [Nocardioidaceae bacterium]|nr:5-oxoprolinase subunit PxpA [Nocardioidaceae bacterium]